MTKLIIELDVTEKHYKEIAEEIAEILKSSEEGIISKISLSGMKEEDYFYMRAWMSGVCEVPDDCMPELIL